MWQRPVGACLILTFFTYKEYIQNAFNFLYEDDQLIIKGVSEKNEGFHVEGVDEMFFNCSDLQIFENIGEGWQKQVFRTVNNNAVKLPRLDGPTYLECLQNNENFICWKNLLQSMADEISWHYKLLNNHCVIKLISYCIPKSLDISQVRIVVEKGDPLTSLFLIQHSWSFRKQIIYNILKIINSLKMFTMNDFRRQQIVMINGIPKLADLDHLIDSPQNKFLPFLETSDAPRWFLDGIKQVSSTYSLEQLLYNHHKEHEPDFEMCN